MKNVALYLILGLLGSLLFTTCTKEDITEEFTAIDQQSQYYPSSTIPADERMGNGRGNNNNNQGNHAPIYDVSLVAGHILDPIVSFDLGYTTTHFNVQFDDGDLVIPTDDGDLAHGASFGVNTNSQGEIVSMQFWVREAPGKQNPLYSTGVFTVSEPYATLGETMTVHIDKIVEVWRLKKWNGGPRQVKVADIAFGDMEFVKQN